jgi:hypothetical protein
MAIKEQLLFGTYVGLVLDTQDPDGLGRVKLIVPGLTGPLFKGWNDSKTDISFSTLSNNPFSPDVLERLLAVLPWAMPSTPLFGGGTGSPVNTSTQASSVTPTEKNLAQPTEDNKSNPTNPQDGGNPSTDNRTSNPAGADNKEGKFDGQQTPLTGSSNCNLNPSGDPMSYKQAKALSIQLNQQMDATGSKITTNNGVMNESSFKAYAMQRLQCSPLLTAKIDPEEAATYHITNTRDASQWADFLWRTALAEQGGRVAASGPDTYNDPGGSWGAWSNSAGKGDTLTYAGYAGKTPEDLQTIPELGANTVISQVENEVCRNNSISGLDHSVTLSGSFAHTTLEALAGRRGTLSAAKSGALVQRTTNLGVNAVGSTNMSRYGSPIGNFSIPQAGSKVWVIFEAGSPHRPVYIGQVYEPSNIGAHS